MSKFYIHEDLSKMKSISGYRGIAIGFLDPEKPYTQGETTHEFRKRLFEFSKFPVNQVRLNVYCPLCSEYEGLMEFEGEAFGKPYSEIWVLTKDNVLYISPIYLFHLVQDHQYKPPDPFVNAVMECDPNWHNGRRFGNRGCLFSWWGH